MASESRSDKTSICASFIRERLAAHDDAARPLMVGLNGVQGVGKTTLVTALAAALGEAGIRALTCSIDDFYLTREQQAALARAHPDNALVQHRGEPGTHDVGLARGVFASLLQGRPTRMPRYDKGAFGGRGDRRPEAEWRRVNEPGQARVDVVLLEGWLVGFRPLTRAAVEQRWRAPSRSLQRHRLEHLLLVNQLLAAYEPLTDLLDAFVHVDADDVGHVYRWRQEQEDGLRARRRDPAAGMTPGQVVEFVDGYFPGYELYTHGVRTGVFADRPGCQLRLVVDRDRRVDKVIRI